MRQGTAQRRFFFMAALTLPVPGLLVWAVVIRDWWLVVMGVIVLPSMIGRLVNALDLAWPESRFGRWYGGLPRFRPPKAQGIVVGFALLISMIALLVILNGGLNAVVLGFVALICAFWLFRLARAIHMEGWRREKRGEK
jgi:hypothetical protein